MSIEEKDPPPELKLNSLKPATAPARQQQFLEQLNRTADRRLVQPFGAPNWSMLAPVLACTVAALLFFSGTINLGKARLNWSISFDVNLVITALLVLVGVTTFGPKIARSPGLLRDQNTMTSLGLLVAAALFFLLRFMNLGIFIYKLDNLDLSATAGVVLLGVLVWLGLAGSVVALLVLGALFLWWGFSIGENGSDFGFKTIADLFTSENGGRLIRSLTPPRWSYFERVIDPMLLTVQTAVASTVVGVIVSLPLSILAARNTTPHPVIYNLVRFLVNTIRAVPSLILALLFIPFVGLGPAAGILGLGIHSISVLTKLYAEAFESVKPQPLEALNAVGANGLKTFRWGVFPQAFPLVASYSIFNWESNGRDSSVVAFVGGGGIGFLLQSNLALLDYNNVAVLLIVLVVTVALLDRLSDFVRARII